MVQRGRMLGLLLLLRAVFGGGASLSSLRPMFSGLSIASFPQGVVDQWRRSLVVARVPLLLTQSSSLTIVTLPRGGSMPLHNRPGSVVLKALYGETSLLHMAVSSVEGIPDSLTEAYQSSVDAFAGDDDCVCRGGRCPRRYGCSFWVEKQLRDSSAYFLANERRITLTRESGITEFQFGDGPRAMLGTSSSAVLELFSLAEEMEATESEHTAETMLYYSASVLLDLEQRPTSTFKVSASASPLGYPPVHIPYRGPSLTELAKTLTLEGS